MADRHSALTLHFRTAHVPAVAPVELNQHLEIRGLDVETKRMMPTAIVRYQRDSCTNYSEALLGVAGTTVATVAPQASLR